MLGQVEQPYCLRRWRAWEAAYRDYERKACHERQPHLVRGSGEMGEEKRHGELLSLSASSLRESSPFSFRGTYYILHSPFDLIRK